MTPVPRDADATYMQLALDQAREAAMAGEVPVGAVVVCQGKVIATGRNAPLTANDPTAHAEIVALRAAAKALGNYRLDGCELYVTLEPCAMCSGAMLHARLARVVFGAHDPKTGVAGSVLNLFGNERLNHQTAVHGGVLEDACARLLKDFFQTRRSNPDPLREDALRTAEACFGHLADYPWPSRFISDLPSLGGWRMHYLDEGPRDAPRTWLCLHGSPTWSYLYRKMIPVFLKNGDRIVAPDLVGFGKSDKPKKGGVHSFSWHRQVLLEMVERLDLRNVVLVVHGWGGMLGLTMPMAAPHRYRGLLLMNTTLATGDARFTPDSRAWNNLCRKTLEESAGSIAPFPDRGHEAGVRAFASMFPVDPADDAAVLARQAQDFFQNEWQGQSLMVIGGQDTVLGEAIMRSLKAEIRHCPEPQVLADAGHLVPDQQGERVAREALTIFAR